MLLPEDGGRRGNSQNMLNRYGSDCDRGIKGSAEESILRLGIPISRYSPADIIVSL